MEANYRMMQGVVQTSQRSKRQDCNSRYEELKALYGKCKDAVKSADDIENSYNNSAEGQRVKRDQDTRD